MKLFLVDTVSTFRNSYVIRAETEQQAYDLVEEMDTDKIDEFSQKWLGEEIGRVMEITEKQYFDIFDKDNDYLKNWSLEKKRELICDPYNLGHPSLSELDAEHTYDPIKHPTDI